MPRWCELAGAAGMSAADADRCLAATTDEDAISKVGEDGVAKYDVSATPTFVINGQAQAGFDAFFERLDAALAENNQQFSAALAYWTAAQFSAKSKAHFRRRISVSRKTLLIVLGVVVLIAGGGHRLLPDQRFQRADAPHGAGYEIVAHRPDPGQPQVQGRADRICRAQLPGLRRISTPQTFPQLKAKYIDTGKVFYVFRVFPLRSDDGTAEKIARCLPEDKYFTFIDLLFKNQPKWDVEFGVQSPEGVHDGLVLLGRIAGMSAEQVDQCMANKAEDDRINKVGVGRRSPLQHQRHADLHLERRQDRIGQHPVRHHVEASGYRARQAALGGPLQE